MFAAIRLLPLLWQIGIGIALIGAVVGAGAYIHHSIYQSGYDAALDKVAAQNKEAVDAVNKRRSLVRNCNATDGMRWDQAARQCVRRD